MLQLKLTPRISSENEAAKALNIIHWEDQNKDVFQTNFPNFDTFD